MNAPAPDYQANVYHHEADSEGASSKYQTHNMLDKLATKTTANKRGYSSNLLNHSRTTQKQTAFQGKSMMSNIKKSGNDSYMSNLEATTVSGTMVPNLGTGQFTNMKQYNRNNQMGQIHTISQEESSDRPGAVSTNSMFTAKFLKPIVEGKRQAS